MGTLAAARSTRVLAKDRPFGRKYLSRCIQQDAIAHFAGVPSGAVP